MDQQAILDRLNDARYEVRKEGEDAAWTAVGVLCDELAAELESAPGIPGLPPAQEPEAPADRVPPGTYAVGWGAHSQQSFRLTIPAGADGWPVVVLVPGGGWAMDAPTPPDLVSWLAARAIVLDVNYQLHDAAQATADVATAIRLAGDHARRWGGGGRLVLVGHSAGGHALALAALDPRYGCPAPTAIVCLAGALVPADGPWDAPPLTQQLVGAAFGGDYALLSASSHVAARPERWAWWLAHGRRDDQIPVRWAADFAAELKTAGHIVHYGETPGDDHVSLGNPVSSVVAATAIRDALQEGA